MATLIPMSLMMGSAWLIIRQRMLLVFATQTKALILFLSDDNPLWATVLVHPPSVGKIAAYMDVGIGTIENWRSGKSVTERTVDAAFNEIIKHIENPPTKLKSKRAQKGEKSPSVCLPLDDDKKEKARRIAQGFHSVFKSFYNKSISDDARPSVYEIAVKILAMTVGQAQKIIDEVIYDRFTIFPYMCYESAGDAGASLKRFAGIYKMWVRRDGRWLQCKLKVRYVIALKSRSAIRCKLNFPITRPEPYAIPYWEYDGFLRIYNNKVFWTFEKRELEGVDFFYFISCRGDVYGSHTDGLFTMAGKYLTVGQNTHNIAMDDVILQRIPAQNLKGGVDDSEEEMHSDVGEIKNDVESRTIDQLLQDFSASSRN
jgi:hypothetical protein